MVGERPESVWYGPFVAEAEDFESRLRYFEHLVRGSMRSSTTEREENRSKCYSSGLVASASRVVLFFFPAPEVSRGVPKLSVPRFTELLLYSMGIFVRVSVSPVL